MQDDPIEQAARSLREAAELFAHSPNQNPEVVARALSDAAAALGHLAKRTDDSERRLAMQQMLLDRRVVRIETNPLFLAFRGFLSSLARGAQVLPLRNLIRRRADARARSEYATWVAQEQALLPTIETARTRAAAWGRRPAFSILIAGQAEIAEDAVPAIRDQMYPEWEICIGGARSGQEAIAPEQFRWAETPVSANDAEMLNTAANIANGEYLIFAAPGGRLSPHATYFFAEAVQGGDLDLLYCDEDSVDPSGQRTAPVFKPDWSPRLLESTMYLGRLTGGSPGSVSRCRRFPT